MILAFWIAGLVAVVATALAVTRANAVHALLYLIVSLLAVAALYALLGAPLAAALEVVVYAGAIVVLFVFVVTLIAQTPEDLAHERQLLQPRAWTGPAALSAALAVLLLWVGVGGADFDAASTPVGPKAVGVALYGPYIVGVEAASFLLLTGLVGAWYVGRGFRQRAAHRAERAERAVRRAS